MKHHKNTGYTLIEVIIALAIFAILGMMSVGLLGRAFDTKARLKAQLDPLKSLQLATARMTHDTAQVLNKGVGKQPPFVGDSTSFSFTRGGFVSLDNTQSTIRRITLSCDNKQLIRKTWPRLDNLDSSNAEEQILLEALDGCSFSYLYPESDSDKQPVLPRAIKLHLTLKTRGDITLMFTIPEGEA